MSESRQTAPGAVEIAAFLRSLALASPAETDAERIDRVAAMERLKAALAATQARETAAFTASQRAGHARASFETRHARRSVGTQIALARQVSPHLGSRFVGMSEALVHELPQTLLAMSDGSCSEWRATIIARETACLSPHDRGIVDATLAGELPRLSDRQVEGRARALAYQLDPRAFLDRNRLAVGDRRVTLRPAPDGMTHLSAIVPLQAGVGCLAALKRAAATVRSAGDERSEGQAMADTLVQRVTGAESPTAIPVEIQLVMTDETLVGDSRTPASIPGHGPVSAPLARQLVRDLPEETSAWVRRLYADPVDGRLTGLDTRRRRFDGPLRKALVLRDDRCRMPFCDAPIKHVDHVISSDDGGATSHRNGQGLCESCNYVKEEPGWQARPDPGGGAGVAVSFTTPTGHTYRSSPPPLPGSPAIKAPRRATPNLGRIDVCYAGPHGRAA